jgi:hypothetical protein
VRFSTAFAITCTKADDWFDPHMTVDTKLFIDPLLMLMGDQLRRSGTSLPGA